MWYYVGTNDAPQLANEKMFWLAVWRRAIFDYVLYKGVRRSIHWKRAYQYIFEETKCEDGFTFDEVCAFFAWDPDYVRRLTKSLTREDIRKLDSQKFIKEFMTMVVSLANNNMRWRTGATIPPFFNSYRYTRDYETELSARKLHKRGLGGWSTPIMAVG